MTSGMRNNTLEVMKWELGICLFAWQINCFLLTYIFPNSNNIPKRFRKMLEHNILILCTSSLISLCIWNMRTNKQIKNVCYMTSNKLVLQVLHYTIIWKLGYWNHSHCPLYVSMNVKINSIIHFYDHYLWLIITILEKPHFQLLWLWRLPRKVFNLKVVCMKGLQIAFEWVDDSRQ